MHKKNLKIEAENPLSLIEFMDSSAADEVKITSPELEEKSELSKKVNKFSWNSLIVTVTLGIVVLLSIFQTVQTVYIYNKIKNQNFGIGGDTNSNSVQNLPSQVGGC